MQIQGSGHRRQNIKERGKIGRFIKEEGSQIKGKTICDGGGNNPSSLNFSLSRANST